MNRVLFSPGKYTDVTILPDPFAHGGELICYVRPALPGTYYDKFHDLLLDFCTTIDKFCNRL